MTSPSAARQASTHRTYFSELDGVRAVAILMVMVFHLSAYGVPLPGFVIFGQTGVDLFFVLSGFLITGILLKAPQRDWRAVRAFYLRRALRIFPLYYATLLGVWILLLRLRVPWDVWIYLQNVALTFKGEIHGPLHFWSLAIEEQFYLVWPFLVLFLARKHLSRVLWGIVVLALVSRALLLSMHFGVFYFTVCRLDALAAGALLALLQYQGRLASMRRVMAVVFVTSLALTGILSMRLPEFFQQLTKYSVLAALYGAGMGLLLLEIFPVVNWLLSSVSLRFVGRISYGLYVFHPFAFLYVQHHAAQLAAPLRALLAFAAAFACALLSWYVMERHFIGLKKLLAPLRARFPATAPSMTRL